MAAGRRGVLATLILLSATAHTAWAARAVDIEFDLPGTRSPAILRWEQLTQALEGSGSVHFFETVSPPKGTLGTAYGLRVFNFIPSEPPRYMNVDQWTFFPERGVIRTNDVAELWLKPSAPLLSLFAQAIRGELPAGPSVWPPPPTPDNRWGAIALVIVLMCIVLFLFRWGVNRAALADERS